MSALVEFLNHGILPFIGRERELATILKFSRNAYDAQELRALAVVGEAGSGKSRLIEEALIKIREEGGLPIHLRLYPDTSLSVVSLLVRGLNRSNEIRSLLRKEIPSELGPLVNALRRITRLRAITLLIEDIHLLADKSLAEFTTLCSALVHDTLSIVYAARPVEGGGRATLDPYLVDVISLHGLEERVVGNLWEQLLGLPPNAELARALHEATVGNPLAIRSALRGTLRDELHRLQHGTMGGRFAEETIARNFRHAADRFSEGLAIHLTTEEREGITSLSWLGEVFSVEGATALLNDNCKQLLESLRFKGMIAETVVAAEPVQRQQSKFPLMAFTHSLVHRQFLESSEPNVNKLISLLGSAAPLYSHLPFELLRERVGACKVGVDEVVAAMRQIRTCASYVDHKVEWPKAFVLLEIAESLLAENRKAFTEEDRKYYEAWLLMYRTGYSRRTKAILPELIAECLERTEGSVGKRWHELRLHALTNSCMLDDSPLHLRNCLNEVKTIVAQEPSIRDVQIFITILRLIGIYAIGNNDWGMLRDIESKVSANISELLQKDRRWGTDHLLIALAYAYQTPEEFREKERLYREVETPHIWRDVRALYLLSRWLLDAFYTDEFLGHIDEMLEVYRIHNSQFYIIMNTGLRIVGRYMVENTPEPILEQIEKISFESNTGIYCRQFLYTEIRAAALIRGELEIAREVATVTPLDPASAILLDLSPLAPPPKEKEVPDEIELDEINKLLLQAFRSSEEDDMATLTKQLSSLFKSHILRQSDILPTMAGLHMAERHGILASQELAKDSVEVLGHLLSFFADPNRRMGIPIKFLLKRYGKYLDDLERKRWSEESKKILKWRKKSEEGEKEEGVEKKRLRMIGEISIEPPGEAPRRLRGERICSLLGTLVLNELLSGSLDQVEFNRLATGEDDPEHARKILKVALFRAREAIGSESITSDDGKLSLNLQDIRVDLLELREALNRADDGLRRGNLVRALRTVREALDIYRGEVIFPSLYNSLFEAIRDEYEARLRHTVVALGDKLLEEGDPQSAERLLREGLMTIPVDDEISELLREALSAQGFFAEAERIRLRGEE
ncbi:MAG: AAA family ATPase [Ignavibacteriae bacterium]|nr:AAA family ATPase [Ignavibacteriota bacterium]MCB9216801.1 AAA family ATPase [Ignavibacteria bacterium]